MINGISMGQYLPAQSIVHRLDPRTKLICAALAVPAVIMTISLWPLILITLWVILAALISGIRPGVYWQSLKPLWFILIISFTLQLFFTPGETLFSFGFITVSREGLINSGWTLWRIAILIIIAAVVTFTTTPLQLTHALEWLLAPLIRVRVPVRELTMMISLALRFIPTLFDEARHLLMAQRSRGVNFTTGSVKDRAMRLIPFMVPLLVNIFRRADELALAMEIRGYRVGAVRSRMNTLKFSFNDYMAFILSAFILAITIIYKIIF